MRSEQLTFGPFCLDAANARLLRGSDGIALKPKVFDVLAYLVRNAGRLVPQEELLDAVWPDTIVGDSSLKSCIRQIRQALGDEAREPKFVETMHRRGYRFIAAVRSSAANIGTTSALPAEEPRTSLIVGRDRELQQLETWLDQARTGQRQIVFVTGGPGSGKTALTEAFVRRARSCLVAGGQCFEQFGSGEAYLPIFEALGRLGQTSAREQLVEALGRHAPSWLAHLPGWLTSSDNAKPPAAPAERMLREMAVALEQFSVETPLILVLEDLHWADYSTLDLVSALARRREAARLMVVATYRPAEAVLSGHPLRAVKQDLLSRGLCRELGLGLLGPESVQEFLQARLPGDGLPTELASLLHERTEGHPLFFVNLVEDWLAQGVLAPRQGGSGWELRADLERLGRGVPASIRALIEKQVERLSPDELHLLQGASVAGVEFASAAAAAAAEVSPGQSEDCCEALARRHQFLQLKGTAAWPDGTVCARYRFVHELYHRVVAEGVSEARRRRLHLHLGERLEAAYRDRTAEVASELALHFERAGRHDRAAHYFDQAAERAARNYAHREAVDYLRRSLTSVAHLPEPERAPREMPLQVKLGLQLQITRGFAAPAAARAYTRARELCRDGPASPHLFPVTWGLWLHHKVRCELTRAREMAEELALLADASGEPGLMVQARQALAVTSLCLGEPSETVRHMEQGTRLYDPQRHAANTFLFGQDPGVACQAFGSVALWLLGYPDRAAQISRDATQRSHGLAQPSSQALALHFAAVVHQCRRDGPATLACADLALAIAAEQGFSFWQAGGTVLKGWAIAECGDLDGGIQLLRQGLDAWQATGSVTYRTYFLALLTELLLTRGSSEQAFPLVEEAVALAAETGERLFEPELHRLRGEALIALGEREKGRDCLRTAIEAARRQKSRSLELRAATSLGRVLCKQGQGAEGREIVESVVRRFSEGFKTRDLVEAKTFLASSG